MVRTAQLPALPDDTWERVLCVVAHPDDMEYGTSAAVASWTARGIEVAYLVLTAGEAGMQRPPEEVAPLRAREQRRACDGVGVSRLTILNHPDGMLEYGLELRRVIAQQIREFRPDVVLTTNFDVEAYGGLNHCDHRNAGLAVVDAVRDADNPWIFRDPTGAGPGKWAAKALLVAGRPDPTHGMVVDADAVQASVSSLAAHEAYLADLPDHPAPDTFIPEILQDGGGVMGSDYAVLFKVFDLGGLAANGSSNAASLM